MRWVVVCWGGCCDDLIFLFEKRLEKFGNINKKL